MGLIAVYDANGYGWPNWAKARDWALSHGGDANTYRYEIHLADRPFARVFRYAVNEDGRKFLDPSTNEAAVTEPLTVPLDELPPEELRIFTS